MTHPMTRTFVACALLTGGFFLGCGGESGGGSQGFAPPPTPVETSLVRLESIVDRFEAVGTIEAADQVEIVAEIDATLLQVSFREGGMVQRGATLARLDDVQLQAEFHRAEALRDQSQTAYDRIKRVVDLGAGAPQDLDDAAAALKVAEANVAFAAARLEKTRIRAPFTGLVGARRSSPGAFLRAGQAITDLTNIRRVRVRFSVPERFLGSLNPGSEVSVSTTAHPDSQTVGKIDFVEPTLDPNTRSARVVAIVENPEGLLRPGMSANVSAVLEQIESALTIPNEAVFVNNEQTMVFVVANDSTVARATIELGLRFTDIVEVTQGLQEGQVVVRAGQQKLRDGVKVTPIPVLTDSVSAEPNAERPE